LLDEWHNIGIRAVTTDDRAIPLLPMRGFFSGRKQNAAQRQNYAFRTVVASGWLAKYYGSLPATPSARHTLICAEIDDQSAKALLAEGFRPIAGALPTHGLFCTVALAKDNFHYRALFNFYLDLTHIDGHGWRSFIAIEVCRGLKKRLRTCTEKALLVRCRASNEFDWCIEDQTIDINWLDDVCRYYKAAMTRYESSRHI